LAWSEAEIPDVFCVAVGAGVCDGRLLRGDGQGEEGDGRDHWTFVRLHEL